MTGKFVSWARRSGKFVNGTQNFSYDNVILYIIEKGSISQKPDSSVVGKPILFHEVKVPAAKWVDVVNADFKELDNLINHDVTVYYDMAEYCGKPICRISSVQFK